MLKQRVITAVILIAIVLGVIVVLPPMWFEVLTGLCILLGAWEWTRLAGVVRGNRRMLYVALFLGLWSVLFGVTHEVLHALLWLSALWWLVAFVLVCRYPRAAQAWHKPAVLLPLGLLVLLPGLVAVHLLRDVEQREFFILLLITLVAVADSGAYFAGRAFGKRKLSPHVSPNKTWEGFAGGQVAACIVLWLVLLAKGIDVTFAQGLLATLGVLLLASASVVGDLFESMLKRQAGVKDSGTLLPGHGGVLDRIDGFTAALPVYGLLLLQAGIL